MALDDARSANGHRYRTPGVYLEEITSPRPTGFRTGVPAFVGFVAGRKAEGQTADHDSSPCLLIRWEQFAQQVGWSVPGFLGYAVRGFFENGGERCVVVPLPFYEDTATTSLRNALKKPFEQGGCLEDVGDIDLVCVPDVMLGPIREPPDAVLEVQQAVLEYCSRMRDRFAILDAFPADGGELTKGALDRQHLMDHRQALWSSEGALYAPWLYVAPLSPPDQKEVSPVLVPPCGHVAGIYARTDARIGVQKAPANEIVEGVLDLEVDLGDEDQAELNEIGVNCLRILPRRGIRVWGARTLSRSPDWRYVNVRRLFLTLTRWLEHNLNDLVFESNSPPLWERVRYRVGSYCYELFQRGALQGRSPDEAFFVKCDAETNPLDVREAGLMIAEVGLASKAPAEFVIVRITQSVAGITVALPANY